MDLSGFEPTAFRPDAIAALTRHISGNGDINPTSKKEQYRPQHITKESFMEWISKSAEAHSSEKVTTPTEHKSLNISCLISGYMRRHERQLALHTHIPSAVCRIVSDFYPSVLCFGAHNPELFEVLCDGTEIKGASAECCSGYLVYADLMNKALARSGLCSGVHSWSLQSLSARSASCYQSVGVTQIKPTEAALNTKSSHWPHEDTTRDSFFCGYQQQWKQGDVVTVELDCDEWTVTYFVNGVQVKRDEVPRGKWFMALSLCASKNLVHLKSVKFPKPPSE